MTSRTRPPNILITIADDQRASVLGCAGMEGAGNRCTLKLYEGQPHGFFNYKDEGNPYFERTMSDLNV
ncbi:hypothetical protein [Puniceicoccus vermicola]|uniref:Dienelactone hydrolase domain-containing protein n=1 Tax=Puniceicoccus vermicola TaxID=388746 RepID=A0A7X1AZF7_9BACT|nr:hypothetical protein [Puniceicoccus vermicola]MBC2602619.1 hypothetical protein [Puniceicoccus vermicola]